MEVALRRRGMGSVQSNADCYKNSFCRAYTDTACYSTGWFTDFCKKWRAYEPSPADVMNIPAPVAIKPPVIDVTPGSPTYGQATIDGQVVGTEEQARVLINRQIDEADAATKAALLAAMGQQASVNCIALADDCSMFTSPNAECTACVFDPTKPAFLLLVFGAVALLVAKPWK